MRRSDDDYLDPGAGHALAVIDATLAGEPVEPEDAELAELSLILAGQRPLPSSSFASQLDARVARRFPDVAGAPAVGGADPRRHWWRRGWLWAPGAMAGAAAIVAVVIVLGSLGGGRRQLVQDVGAAASGSSTVASSSSASAGSAAAGTVRAPSKSAAGGGTAAGTGAGANHRLSLATGHSQSASQSAAAGTFAPNSHAGTPAPAPSSPNRQVIQGAQLTLSTRPDEVDAVSQQVFDVVAAQSGYVRSSTVTSTGTPAGFAQFQLSVPSANLQATMTALSRIHGAAVLARTDTAQDVTADLGADGRHLADARALRRSLLRRLAAATTTEQINGLKAQIGAAEAAIARDVAALGGLHHRVENSQISVTLNSSLPAPHRRHAASGFSLGGAAHDAGRVLVVAAGVALIALAVLVPLALLGALGLWFAVALRRRRREQALDLI